MSSSTLLPLTVTIPLQWAKVLRLPRQRLNIKGVVSWSMIDEKRALCVRIRFLWTRTAPSLNVVWFSRTLPFSRYCADSGPDVQKSEVIPQMQSLDKLWIWQLLC